MENRLLELALNSILHGSTQIVSRDDGNGNIVSQEIRVNDLRLPLVKELAHLLSITPAFNEAITKALLPDVIAELKKEVIGSIRYDNIPWETKRRIEEELKFAKLEVKKFRIIAEAVEEEKQI